MTRRGLAFAGFTLVELVMVIALAGLVAVMIGSVLNRPMQGFVDQSRRAELVDLAAIALNQMARDIRLAVPNSVRKGVSGEIEMLRAPVGGRYRANLVNELRHNPPICPVAPCDIPVLGPLRLDDLDLRQPLWMVIYPTGQRSNGFNVWSSADEGASVIAPRTRIERTSEGLRLMSVEAFRFRSGSPQHRFFLADKVIGYRCVGGRILRGEFDSLEPSYDYAGAAVVAANVDCVNSAFTYDEGTNTRNGLVTIRLRLTKDGETISLLQQVHVDNAP